MAASLLKLAIAGATATTTDIEATVEKYFYKVNLSDIVGGVLTIPAASFLDNSGTAVTAITPVDGSKGYAKLSINGVLQQEDLYTVSAANVVINDAAGILVNTPITLSINNFNATSDSNTTITT